MLQIPTSALLERALAASALRQKLLANNIANVETPGYKRFDLAMREAMRQDATTPLAGAIYRQSSTSWRLDGNNVDIDSEMASVAANSVYFDAVASSLNQQLATLRYLINEGRR